MSLPFTLGVSPFRCVLVRAVEFVPNGCLVFGDVWEKQLCMKVEDDDDDGETFFDPCLVLLASAWRVGRKKFPPSRRIMRQKNDKTAEGKTSIVVVSTTSFPDRTTDCRCPQSICYNLN